MDNDFSKQLASEYILPKYASPFDNIKFLTKEAELIDSNFITEIDKKIDRVTAMSKLNKLLDDIQCAILIEASIYEFTIVYSNEKNLAESIVPSVYENKLLDLILCLSPDSKTFSEYLLDNVINKTINIQEIAFLSPQSIDPHKWEIYKRKQELKEYMKENMAATNLYKCFKCGERKCKVTELQTRSADEPMTSFVTCLICHNTWKH